MPTPNPPEPAHLTPLVVREGNSPTHLLAKLAALYNWTRPVLISYLPFLAIQAKKKRWI